MLADTPYPSDYTVLDDEAQSGMIYNCSICRGLGTLTLFFGDAWCLVDRGRLGNIVGDSSNRCGIIGDT